MAEVSFITNPQKEDIIMENEKSIALHFPKAVKAGHFIVACKSQVRFIEDIPPDEMVAVSMMLQEVCKRVGKILNCERFYIASVGDFDHHFHFHAIPKFQDEPNMGKFIFSNEGWVGLIDTSNIDETKKLINLKFDDK